MRTIHVPRGKAAVASVAGMALFAVAFLGADGCAGDAEADPTPVQTFKITPAANAVRSPEATNVVTTPTIPLPPPDAAGGARTIAIAAVGSTFDVEEVETRAGSITIEFDNRDGGTIHNVHVFKGNDADGESVAETELDVGPIKQTVTFDAEPGEYFYQCDSHPTTMEGTLRLE